MVDGNVATQATLDEGADRISELEKEIEEIRARMQLAQADQASLDAATATEMDTVKPVSEFFGAQSKMAAPANDTESSVDSKAPVDSHAPVEDAEVEDSEGAKVEA